MVRAAPTASRSATMPPRVSGPSMLRAPDRSRRARPRSGWIVMPAFLVVGDANADVNAELTRFPHEGDDCPLRALGWSSGGSAANVATALALLRARARLLTRVGVDPAAVVALRAAAAAGVELDLVQRDAAIPTGSASPRSHREASARSSATAAPTPRSTPAARRIRSRARAGSTSRGTRCSKDRSAAPPSRW